MHFVVEEVMVVSGCFCADVQRVRLPTISATPLIGLPDLAEPKLLCPHATFMASNSR